LWRQRQRSVSLKNNFFKYLGGQLLIFPLFKKKALNYVNVFQLSVAFRAFKLTGTYSVVRKKHRYPPKSFKNSSALPSLDVLHCLKLLPKAEQCLFQETANKYTVSG
jgi:hypothetical protein